MLQTVRALRNARALHRSGIRAFSEWKEYKHPGREYPTFTSAPADVPQPQHGILGQLHGTWANYADGPTGMHTTCMPAPGSSSEETPGVGAFVFHAQNYTERLTFTQVNEAVRNRGGSNEQFNGPMKYEQVVNDTDGHLQHFENGMYLWLGQYQDALTMYPEQHPPTMMRNPASQQSVEENEADFQDPTECGNPFYPPHSISRSGVIPHGTTIHLTGKVTKSESDKEPLIADLWDTRYLSVDATMGFQPQRDLIAGSLERPAWTNLSRAEMFQDNMGQPYISKLFTYDQNGTGWPYTIQPNLMLSEANKGLKFNHYDLIELDSRHETGLQGATVNNVMIDRYCKVTRMRYRMWIQQVEDPELGRVVDQLQYEQIVDFEFMMATNGEITKWPHIQVNTMRRLEDIPDEKVIDPFELPTPDTDHRPDYTM